MSAYETLRESERQRRDYSDAQATALSSARYLADEFVKQKECNALECRLKSRQSGYEIQMIFGKNGKAQPSQYIPLKGVTHVDDAMDIFLELESRIFSEYGKDKNPQSFVLPATRELRPISHEPTVRPRVNIITILRNEKNIPQGVIDLDPGSIKMVDESYATGAPPSKPKASTDAKIINAGEKNAMLVVHCWYATEKGNARTCSQLSIPLGADFAQSDEVRKRAAFAVNYMKEAIASGKSLTPQQVIDALSHDVTQVRGKEWKLPKTHYVPGYETVTNLNFPAEVHGQETLLTAATLQQKKSADAGPYIELNFRFKVRQGEQGQWFETAARGINLQTNNVALGEARAERVMADIRELFETTLVQGQTNKSKVVLPPDWQWDMSAVDDKQRYIVNKREGTHVQKTRKGPDLAIEDAKLNADNIFAIIDHGIGTYADDLAVRIQTIDQGRNKSRFVLELMRGTRDSESALVTNNGLPFKPEPIKQVNPHKANDFQPVEVIFDIDHHGLSPQQVNDEIEKFSKAVDMSTRDQATLRYRSSVGAGDKDLLSRRPKYYSTSVVGDFVTAIRSHMGDNNYSNIDIARTELNDGIRRHFTTAPRSSDADIPWKDRQGMQTDSDGHDGAASGRH